MTAFSTPCSKRTESAWIWRAWWTLVLWVVVICASAQGIHVTLAEIVLGEDEYYSLNADFDVVLGTAVESALNRGVPLTFVIEAQVKRPRWYWFDETAAQTRSQYRLSYNALTQQYRVTVGNLFQNFGTLAEALQLLSRVRNRPIAARDALAKGETYRAAVRFRLDTTQLPKPFQVTALASREWSLDSDWYRWSFTP